jgi:hypothetical protein
MATSILLLDCTEDLARRVKAQGHDVCVGTSGYCTGHKSIPRQIYETDLVIFEPRVIFQRRFATRIPRNETAEIDFSYEALMSRVSEGGHWLVFLNRLSDDLPSHQWLYSWLPMKPQVAFTLDQKLKRLRNPSSPFMEKFLPFVDSPRAVDIVSPTRLKIAGWDLRFNESIGFFSHLVANNRDDALGGVFNLGYGTVTVFPKCQSNDDAAMFFLDYVWPKIEPSASRGGLVEEFKSPSEEAHAAEIQIALTVFEDVGRQYHEAQQKMSEARQLKQAKIAADETAQLILGYYRDAQEDQRDAHHHLYKVREGIANKYPDDTAAKAALVDCNGEWNLLGHLTNAPARDARHAPIPGEPLQPLTAADIQKLFEAAKKMILAYFKTLFP